MVPRDLYTLVRPGLVILPALTLAAGLGALGGGWPREALWIWGAGATPVLAVLAVQIVTSLRRGDFGLDIVAALSMAAALLVGETLAACVVALMYAGGQYLESFAERRARREMTALLQRAPRTAMRYGPSGLEEVGADAVQPGDRLLIRRGDIVPVDGVVHAGRAVLDQSALTGEAMPVGHAAGAPVLSGASNAGDAFDLIAERRAAESTYAGIVRLVEQAQHSRAPMNRLADRYALVFLAITVVLALAAWWVSGDPVRAVAVLVVATPCPLILAVPVALIAGLSRAARHGVLIKGAKPLETMAQIRVVVMDKTGTLTEGRPGLSAILPAQGYAEDDLLALAASLDQASQHPIARAIVDEAQARGLHLSVPQDAVEAPGEGVCGSVEGRTVCVGGRGFVAARLGPPNAQPVSSGTVGAVRVSVACDGAPAGDLVFSDAVRAGAARLLAGVRGMGVERIVLATGDRRAVAQATAEGLGVDVVHAELTPEQKVLVVLSERKHGPVMMVGDGVNDAPALAAADVGVAMGARGMAAASEVADVVLLVEDIGRLVAGIGVARGARRIALQSVLWGLGLSLAGMVAAAMGLLVPVEGALIQEAIDVAVILNALRALRLGALDSEGRGVPVPSRT